MTDDLKRLITEEELHDLKELLTRLKDDRDKFWIPFKNNLHKHLRLTTDAIGRIDACKATVGKLIGEK